MELWHIGRSTLYQLRSLLESSLAQPASSPHEQGAASGPDAAATAVKTQHASTTGPRPCSSGCIRQSVA